jgi:hypothetical protein
MIESSFHQVKSYARKNGKENEAGLKMHAPYPIGGEIQKLRQLRTKGNIQNLPFVR